MSTRLRSSTRASTAASESLAETNAEISKPRSESRKSTYARPLKNSELARLYRIAVFAAAAAFTVIGLLYHFSMNDTLKLYPDSIKIESLKGFSSRAEYSLRYQTLLFGWLVFNIFAVVYVRNINKALNPLVDSTEKHCTKIKNILTNSFEQVVISSFSQLIFVSFSNSLYTLKLIPAINIIQLVGRIAFMIGYPYYRTFGMLLTMTPNLLMVIYNLYKFGKYAGLY